MDGVSEGSYSNFIEKWFDEFKEAAKAEIERQMAHSHEHPKITVDSRDANLNYLYNKVIRDPSMQNHAELQDEISMRMKVDTIFNIIGNGDKTNFVLPTNYQCLKTLVNAYENYCAKFNDYSLKYVKYLVRECETSGRTVDESITRIQAVCNE